MKRSLLPAFLVALAAVIPCAAAAGTGYHTDYDYPGQGDDWYGRSRPIVIDPLLDFYAYTSIPSLEGDDYGFGYDPIHDPLGWGPPLERTQTKQTEYVFRFAVLVPCQGGHSLGCDDWVFCNGDEVCVTGICSAGTRPLCDDGDVCTVDVCDDALDACVNPAGPGPGEVGGVLVERAAVGSTVARFHWSSEPLASWYNLYRGTKASLGDLGCHVSNVSGNTVDDDGDFGPQVLYYLVTATGCGIEGGIGEDSGGTARINPAVCP
jgi:hypothetical protein